MTGALDQLRNQKIEVVVFGDLYLEDIREYRESRMQGSGLRPEFPLWGRPTAELARTMIDAGLEATLVCVDPRKLPANFAGRRFDLALLRELPAEVDPCGERGEFHTFVSAGPMFRRPVPVAPGMSTKPGSPLAASATTSGTGVVDAISATGPEGKSAQGALDVQVLPMIGGMIGVPLSRTGPPPSGSPSPPDPPLPPKPLPLPVPPFAQAAATIKPAGIARSPR